MNGMSVDYIVRSARIHFVYS